MVKFCCSIFSRRFIIYILFGTLLPIHPPERLFRSCRYNGTYQYNLMYNTRCLVTTDWRMYPKSATVRLFHEFDTVN